MRIFTFAASALLGMALFTPEQASACGGCGCMMMRGPTSGCMPGMSMSNNGKPMANHNHQKHGNGNGHNAHAEAAGDTSLVAISVSGMTCNACVAKVQKALAALPGVKQVQVDLRRKLAVVTADADKCDEKALLKALDQSGYGGKVVK